MVMHDPRDDDRRDDRLEDPRERGDADPRDRDPVDPREVFRDGLDLPRGPEREHVYVRDDAYELRGSEVRTLATIGAFRVVPVDELRDDRGEPGDLRHGDLHRLRSAGLIDTVAAFDRGGERTTLVVLTDRGRELLESHRNPDHEPRQTFYAGDVRERELSHDAQLHRAYERAAERLMKQDVQIRRVVLDHELKREYQQWLQERNRDRPDSDGRPGREAREIEAWAHEHALSYFDDRVHFPDLRIEYEWPDGRHDVENVEVTTLHYRGAHAAAKARAGFTQYRGRTSRVGGGGSPSGGAPFDPEVAEEFLE
jgi:DNA-binding PadR family transcriptional regulator